MYDEKVNYGTETEPIWRDRLWINSNGYGYGWNLFDRKEKKHMIFGQTKEFCEKGKELLKKMDLAGFSKHLKETQDFVTNQILIYKEKHGDSLFNVSTLKQLYRTSLYIIEMRLNDGYIQEYNLPEDIGYTEADIENLPEVLKKVAKEKLDYYKANLKSIQENNQLVKDAKVAVETGDGALAWSVLNSRSGYEYETFEIVKLTDIEDETD